MATSKSIDQVSIDRNLLAARLDGQLLADHNMQTPLSIVQKMGAIQAQHFDMAKWAIGARLCGCSGTDHAPANTNQKLIPPTINDIYKAMEKGEIVRTHVLRPTWHIVAGQDLLWTLQLTAPAIKGALFSRDKKLGIVEKEYVKSDEAIQRILEDQPALNRRDLITALSEYGFAMDEYRSNHYIMHAELNGIICSGPVKDDKHTYALAENVLGKHYAKAILLKDKLQGDAAVIELAKRYFTTRGPATLQDFAWWSGLGMTVIKKAVTALGKSIERLQQGDSVFYQVPAIKTGAVKEENDSGLQLLPAFDEYLISYKDRSRMLPTKYNSQIITVNGLFRPAIIKQGRVIGGWQVDKGKHGCKITLMPFESIKVAEKKKMQAMAEVAASIYCGFRQTSLEKVIFA
ncbi:winged helix DNA-binding domain-containing protein [Arachidicoccus terrestris]|uniref:winged helix DNA-binding domain-containing protein n=1 Tax=Arachidicoccus terrestris TaxID=2875539 RepID=UPI001CC43522|nr:winged helix DNA-binding domain-containing protein [Arachidicoccus terrestris]UAY56393.1 winged helix DNA-binding domain-containing protein [Arachidicoccus terrestris]